LCVKYTYVIALYRFLRGVITTTAPIANRSRVHRRSRFFCALVFVGIHMSIFYPIKNLCRPSSKKNKVSWSRHDNLTSDSRCSMIYLTLWHNDPPPRQSNAAPD